MRLVPVLSGAAAWGTTCARPHVLGTSMGCKYSHPPVESGSPLHACVARGLGAWYAGCTLRYACCMLHVLPGTWHMDQVRCLARGG